jgi:hypothetical protein
MGEVSGSLICRDFDDMGAYEKWAEDHAKLAAECPTVATGRPGRHVYFRADVVSIEDNSGKTILDCGDGELRAGGYCVAPPSLFPGKDGRYSWLHPLRAEIPIIDPFAAGLTGERRVPREHGDNRDNRDNRDPRPPSTLYSPGTLEARIEMAIKRCLPNEVGFRNRCLFNFARELKAIPELKDKDVSELKSLVRRWHRAALSFIGTEPFEESWIDFFEAWPKVKYAAGDGPLNHILKRAINSELPEEALQFGHPPIRLLVAICREIQRHAGDQPFYLSTRVAGRLLDVDHKLASRWLRLLEQDGLLEVTIKGNKKKATRFRYLGTR